MVHLRQDWPGFDIFVTQVVLMEGPLKSHAHAWEEPSRSYLDILSLMSLRGSQRHTFDKDSLTKVKQALDLKRKEHRKKLMRERGKGVCDLYLLLR